MPKVEYLFAGLIVAASLGVALAFGFRQLRQLRTNAAANTEEQHFLYRTARRRLLIGLLLGAAGVLMAVNYLAGWDKSFLAIGEERAAQAAEDRRPLDAGERAIVKTFGYSWVAVLLLLLAIMFLVAWDLNEVRRHWRRGLTRIRDDRRAMIERQVAEIRARRGYTDNNGDE